ncbi:sigma-54-dependent Fis family transcriptional regulator, partial [Campylobacter lari]
ERQEEILQIAQKVLLDTCKEYDFNEKTLSQEAQDALLTYDFPGNIRELISIIQRACILSENDEISAQDLFLESRKSKDIKNLEKELILEALKNSQDITEAAKLIGMSEKIFSEKMKKYNIT